MTTTPATERAVTIAMVEEAAARLAGQVAATPCKRSRTLSEITGADVVVKFENLQFTASFKERGALNRLLHLDAAERSHGVVAASSGNHAQAVAYHASRLGIPATIVMPEVTSLVKVARTRSFGARVVTVGATVADATREARRLEREEGLTLVHPYDDPLVIAGQGTVALEMLSDEPDLDVIVVPVGGGGLIAGIAVATRATAPNVEVLGVQSEHHVALADAFRGATRRDDGGPTIADGLAVQEPGSVTTALARELVDDVTTVREESIEEAVVLYLEVEKTVAEGAGAASLALLREQPERFAGRRVGLVLSGGNIDPRLLASVTVRGLCRQGRIARFVVELDDVPGRLAGMTRILGDERANIIEVEHRRLTAGVPPRRAVVELLVETLDEDHAAHVESVLRTGGYDVRREPV